MMSKFRTSILSVAFAAIALAGAAKAETAADLNRESDNALQQLYRANPAAAAIGRQAGRPGPS